jgi:DNA invertase Pin-like site-specific DNA recombinase
MPKAYSYLRFSTPEQMKGDSHRRQSTLAQKYATEHHLDLDDTLTFKDLGVSAFRDKNAGEEGQLGAFLAAVEAGKVAPGSYLLVESLDRINREAAWIVLGTLTNILARGISLVTFSDGKVYSQASMTMKPHGPHVRTDGFIRANDESAHKSMRLKAVWTAKRAKADKCGAKTNDRNM